MDLFHYHYISEFYCFSLTSCDAAVEAEAPPQDFSHQEKKPQPFLVKKNLKYSVSTVIASGKTTGRTPALDCPLVTETHFKLRGDPAENDADPS